jgi:chromate transporter
MGQSPNRATEPDAQKARLTTVAVQWLRLGFTGFGGPPAHITLLRRLCVEQRRWLSEAEFEDGVAATNLLPGPASTQLAIYCAWRLRGAAGAIIGGLGFIVPGLVLILGLSALLLAGDPNPIVLGAAAGAGAAVAAVAIRAAADLVPASWRRAATNRSVRLRWLGYLVAGAVATASAGAWVVFVLLACGLVETLVSHRAAAKEARSGMSAIVAPATTLTGLAALAWVAFKVGALSYGGGFVIIPLMQYDAVVRYHWMSDSEFLYAVALGQITPGPVVHTVAVVGYAEAGVVGGLLAAAVAFAPSFVFVLAGARHFDRLRANQRVQAFLSGAGPAAIGAILGSALLLGLAIGHVWQVPVLVAAALWLLLLRRGVVAALLGSGTAGLVAALAGFPVG